ncbi:MAG: hypothetical protein WDN24_02230 [Sphingomonas sp.]
MDEYLKYGFFAEGIIDVLTAEEMSDPETIRWIKNTAAGMEIPFRKWLAFIDGYYRDAPKIFVRTRKRDGERREMYLPLVRAFDHPGIDWWFRDFCVAVPDNITPRLPRREAKLRVWVLGCLLRSMRNTK